MYPYPPQSMGFPAGRRHTMLAALPLHVLVRLQPSGSSTARVMCEPVKAGPAAGAQAMVLYLSPFDAHLDALWLGLAVEDYQVLPLASFSPDELVARHQGHLPYCLHLAWGAHDGRIAVRAQGDPVRLSSARVAQVSASIDSIPLDIGLADLECHARLWECAGLYAHAETAARLEQLNPQQRHWHAERAMERIPGRTEPGREINQIALYDAESAQWHFVALDFLAEMVAGPR